MTDSTHKHSPKSDKNSDKDFKNIQDKVFDLLNKDPSASKEDIDRLRQENRKIYKRKKNQLYKSRWVRQTIRFTPEEIEKLSLIAEKFGMQRTHFLKSCIYAYLNNEHILINDQKIRTLELGVNHISTKINETIRYIHNNKHIEVSDVEKIKAHIERLTLVIDSTMRTLPNLKEWILENVKDDPTFIQRLKAIITQIEDAN